MAISIWGNVANQGYALPMVKLVPFDPTTSKYLLGWSPAATDGAALDYLPISVDASSGEVTTVGSLNLPSNKVVRIGINQIIGARVTGWAAPTGTSTRSTFATSTVTLSQLAERVKALLDDLTTHGLIGD